MKLNPHVVAHVKREYCSLEAGVREELPEALQDPLIAAAVAHIQLLNIALAARLDELTEDIDDEN
jgi:hypothetical protein